LVPPSAEHRRRGCRPIKGAAAVGFCPDLLPTHQALLHSLPSSFSSLLRNGAPGSRRPRSPSSLLFASFDENPISADSSPPSSLLPPPARSRTMARGAAVKFLTVVALVAMVRDAAVLEGMSFLDVPSSRDSVWHGGLPVAAPRAPPAGLQPLTRYPCLGLPSPLPVCPVGRAAVSPLPCISRRCFPLAVRVVRSWPRPSTPPPPLSHLATWRSVAGPARLARRTRRSSASARLAK